MRREKKVAVLSALVEGCSVRSVERMTGVHRDSIVRLLRRLGEGCEHLLAEKMQKLDLRHIQADEIWSYVHTKEGHLRWDDPLVWGDQYVFVAMDASTKLVPCFVVGRRDGVSALEFMYKLRDCLNGNRIQLTTDGFAPYVEAVEAAFGADVDYAQEIKQFREGPANRDRYRPPQFIATQDVIIQGNPEWDRISTSYVERQNLTMRMEMRRFTRLTNAFSKTLESLRAAVALHFAHYNFVRRHSTLRITPAMAAKVTSSPPR